MNNFENGYEDSYQKRDRLRNELRSVMDDVIANSNVPRSELNAVKNSMETIGAKMEEIKVLQTEIDDLYDKYLKKIHEMGDFERMEKGSDVSNDSNLIWEEIEDLREKIFEREELAEILKGQVEALVLEQNALLGDCDSSTVAMRMKLDRIEELEKQIKELDDEQ